MARRNLYAFAAVCLVTLVVVPFLPPYVQYVAARAAIAALFAAGFNLVFGFGGIASLGGAALAGGGAYTVALLETQVHAPGVAIAGAVVLYGAVTGAFMGVATLRTRGIYALLLTLMLAQSLWGLASQNVALTGGDNGITGIIRPGVLQSDGAFGFGAIALTFAGVFAVWCLIASRFGRLLVAARANELRLRSLGVEAAPLRIGAFAISGIVCASAGALGALFRGSVNPADLDWPASANVLVATILGGASTVAGPPLAAAALVALEAVAGSTQRWPTILGAIFVATAVFVPRGLGGRLWRRERFVVPAVLPAPAKPIEAPLSGTLLRIAELNYAIGPNRLFRGFSLTMEYGERRAIVGPNGVGKSTLFALICGERRAQSGQIEFAGRDMGKASSAARARAGIGRTFQFGALFDDHTVAQNLRVAALAARLAAPDAAVAAALERWSLDSDRDRLPGELAAGRRRVVELALASLSEPKLLLLDEPTAGLERSEIQAVIEAIRSLPPTTAVLVIEHDAEVADAIAGSITELRAPDAARS
ncbi:MAG: hypothetical protein NVSMB64_07990 [Candidatus Velthaea sp.]